MVPKLLPFPPLQQLFFLNHPHPCAPFFPRLNRQPGLPLCGVNRGFLWRPRPPPPQLPSQSSLERSASTFLMTQVSCPLPFSSWPSHPLSSSSSVSSLFIGSFLSAHKNPQQPPAASAASPRSLSSPSWASCFLQPPSAILIFFPSGWCSQGLPGTRWPTCPLEGLPTVVTVKWRPQAGCNLPSLGGFGTPGSSPRTRG